MHTLQEVIALAEARFGARGAAQWLNTVHPVMQCAPILLAASASGRTRLMEWLQELDRIDRDDAEARRVDAAT